MHLLRGRGRGISHSICIYQEGERVSHTLDKELFSHTFSARPRASATVTARASVRASVRENESVEVCVGRGLFEVP